MKIHLKNWIDLLSNEISRTKKLRIISPFVKEQVLRNISDKFDMRNLELITKYCLRDFASGVSSLKGLMFAIEKGSSIYGIRDLHSKIYLFDHRTALVTSANLTSGGLKNNYECGIFINEASIIEELHEHFNELVEISKNKLELHICEEWQSIISSANIPISDLPSLPDYGASKTKFNTDKGYYVKFFGTAEYRKPFDYLVRDEIDSSLCHYACGFSVKKKPRRFKEGDIIYLARMTYPNNYSIFGKAEAIQYNEIRDIASSKEKKERPWKNDWPVYLRLKNTRFIDTQLGNCTMLYDLIEQFQYMSFKSTERRYLNKEKNINPYLSLSQQPYVRLTISSAEWLESRFQENINTYGSVSDKFILSLPQSTYRNQ